MVVTSATRTVSTRERIINVALDLLAHGGRAAVSTRAVSLSAGVQPPAIYRLFGDKAGLLDALAAHGYAAHMAAHAAAPTSDDPVDDLRAGWDAHVAFGLANPYLYSLIYGEPCPGPPPPGATEALRYLAMLVHRIAVTGRLAVEENAAVQLLAAAGTGTTLTLIATPKTHLDPGLSHRAREAVIAAVTNDATGGEKNVASAAVTLRSLLTHITSLTDAEQELLAEWLDRVARQTR